jgi:hypothetical protein
MLFPPQQREKQRGGRTRHRVPEARTRSAPKGGGGSGRSPRAYPAKVLIASRSFRRPSTRAKIHLSPTIKICTLPSTQFSKAVLFGQIHRSDPLNGDNPFKDEMDWAPNRIFKDGKRQFCDLFSGNWVWEQTVRSLFLRILKD